MEITKPTTHSLGTTSPQPPYELEPLMYPLTKDPTITILSYIEDAPWRLSPVSKQWRAFAEEVYIRLWITYKAKPELQKYILKIELEYSTCSRRVLTLYKTIMAPINGLTPFSHNHALSCLDASQLIKFSQAPTLCQFFDAWNARNYPVSPLKLSKNPTIAEKGSAIAVWLQNNANNDLRLSWRSIGSRSYSDLCLSKSNLKVLPDSIGCLTKLEILWVCDNQLQGIPDSIGNLTKLEQLYAFLNQLTKLPDSIGRLTNLKNLHLNNNRLTKLPKSIENWTSLSVLNLNDNQLIELPKSIENWTSLLFLNLKNNQLTELPDSIGNLSSLLLLDLSNNRLTKLPDSIGDLINLEKLYLDNNRLTMLPNSIYNLIKLSRLALQKNKLTEIPTWIEYLPCLRDLTVK